MEGFYFNYHSETLHEKWVRDSNNNGNGNDNSNNNKYTSNFQYVKYCSKCLEYPNSVESF